MPTVKEIYEKMDDLADIIVRWEQVAEEIRGLQERWRNVKEALSDLFDLEVELKDYRRE